MTTLKLITAGTATGVIIPDDILAHMNVTQGDLLDLIEAPDGSFRLTASDPASEAKMDKAKDIMDRYRDTLSVLTK